MNNNDDRIDSLRPTFESLCNLVRDLGYKDPFYQLQYNSGAAVGDGLVFFEDNPGAISAVFDWIREHHAEALAEMELEGEDNDNDE